MPDRDEFTQTELEALKFIRNSVVHMGRVPSVRELMRALDYKSPRSAVLVIEVLIRKGFLRRRLEGSLQMRRDLASTTSRARTVDVPLVGEVACGAPMLARENIEGYIPVSTTLAKPGHRYFLLRARGDSMNEASINDGDLVLVRQQPTAEDGERVVALIDDEATVKVLQRGVGAIALVPRSTNKRHRPIILAEDFNVQGVVVATVPKH